MATTSLLRNDEDSSSQCRARESFRVDRKRALTRRDGHLPDSDEVVRVAGVQGLTIRRPSHGQTFGRDGTLVSAAAGHFRAKFLDHGLAFQVPDLDDGAGGGAEPVAVGREAL